MQHLRKKILTYLFTLFLAGSMFSQRMIKIEGNTYNMGIISKELKMGALSKEMLLLHIDLSYTFNINEEELRDLHNELGADYMKLFCEPIVKDAVGEIYGRYTIYEIFSDKSALIHSELYQIISNEFMKYHIHFRDIYIKEIELPENVKTAIEDRLIAEQENQRQNYLKEIEAKKLEISRLKAKAIADCNFIIDSSLTEKVLQLKYIETLEKLAGSENAKVIIVGDGKIELPKILNEGK